MTRSRRWAWGLTGGIVLAYIGYVLLDTGAGPYHDGPDQWALAFVVVGSSTVVGLLLALRRPEHPIGWMFLVNAACTLSAALTTSWPGYALNHPGTLPGGRLLAIYDSAAWPLFFAALIAIVLVFPDGRLPFRRPRLMSGLGLLAVATIIAAGVLRDEAPDKPFDAVEPYGVLPTGVTHPVLAIATMALLGFGIYAAVAIRRRYVRGDQVVRSQVKWLMYATALAPVTLLLGAIETVAWDRADPGYATLVPFLAFEAALPAAVAVAVLRHRLYEIDRLINRTIVYVALTAGLGTIFAVVTLALGVALGSGSKLPTVVATLAVVAAFAPLRGRLQAAMDRRFDRVRYDAVRGISAYLDRLRAGQAAPEDVQAELARAVGDPTLQVLYWLEEERAYVDADGAITTPAPAREQTPVVRGDRTLALVVHDASRPAARSLVASAIQAAALAIEIARLRVEVHHRTAEVEASRERILTAAEDERRRLERDLHDGTQQRLVAIGLMLREVQADLDPAGPIRVELDRVVGQLKDAVEDLRGYAYGVWPGEARR